jgi:hypothetical protein
MDLEGFKMNKKQIISIILIFLIGSISFTTGKNNQTIEKNDITVLARLSFSNKNLDFINKNQYELLGVKPGEWIDIILYKKDVFYLEQANIDYTITIENVEEYDNKVRGIYHTFPEIEQYLQDINTNYPSITSLYSIGTSYEGRTIWCLEITDNPGVDEGEPGVFYMGLHHAREWPTVEICLYTADQLTSNYGSDPDITNVVNNRRLWLVACVNPDGYVYDHDQGHDWRKNRHYFPAHGTYGVDLNRNYGGSSNGNPKGSWGSLGAAYNNVYHNPSQSQYCGPGSLSELEVKAIRDVFLQNDICASITWHTHSELVLWPWAYSQTDVTPDNTYISSVGTEIANRITQQDGTGTYDPEQASFLYPTTGDTCDWVYGYGHYVLGRPTFVYTIEACTSFHPSASYLDQICEENFDGALYLLEEAQNINNVVPRVVPPAIYSMTTDQDGNYTVSWVERNPAANPDYFQLDELTGASINLDDGESGSSYWNLDGFTLTTSKSHSATHSFKARNSNTDVSSMNSSSPIPITSGMNLSFWCWYDIENNYDKGFVEISRDNRYFEILDNFTGNSNGWIYKEYPLDDYVGDSIFIRFRYTTDSGSLGEGFFIDDIFPLVNFSSVVTISDTISTTSYDIVGNSPGIYYYRVKGYNTEHGWGDFSTLKSMNVTGNIISFDIQNVIATPQIQENPGWVNVSCRVISIQPLNSVKINITDPDGSFINISMSRISTTNNYFNNRSYSNVGTYSYYIMADTLFNQQIISYLYYFYIGQNYKSISLAEDWNLITIPVESSWKASEIAINITGCMSISRWDNVNQTYNTYIVGGPPIFDFPIKNGSGYFVDTETESIYAINGSSITTVQVPLKVGWNLIGWYHDYNTTASSLAANIPGSLSVSRWDNVNQTYQTYIVGGPPVFDFTIRNGMGIFVDVNVESIWSGGG